MILSPDSLISSEHILLKTFYQACGYSHPARERSVEVSELLLSGAGARLHPCSTEGMFTAQTLKAVQPCLEGHVLGFIALFSQAEHTISTPRPLLFPRQPQCEPSGVLH